MHQQLDNLLSELKSDSTTVEDFIFSSTGISFLSSVASDMESWELTPKNLAYKVPCLFDSKRAEKLGVTRLIYGAALTDVPLQERILRVVTHLNRVRTDEVYCFKVLEMGSREFILRGMFDEVMWQKCKATFLVFQ